MEDINYVFNGEIRGNFNSYILIYDNFFLLKAICLGCALRSSQKAKMAIFVVFKIFGVKIKKTMKRLKIGWNMWRYDVRALDDAF